MADENVPFDDVDGAVTWIADSGLFIACGRQQNNTYTALERFTRRNDITFVIPQRVYDELGGAPDRSTPGQTPINSAIDAGWVAVADEPDYTDSTVSRGSARCRRTCSNVPLSRFWMRSWSRLLCKFARLARKTTIRRTSMESQSAVTRVR